MNKLLTPPRSRLFLPRHSGGGAGRFSVDAVESGFPLHLLTVREQFALGLVPSISGGARGTSTQGDVLAQTADGRDLNEVWAEFQRTLDFWNANRSALVAALTFPVQSPIEDVPQMATEDFEEASEFGVPKGLRGGDYFSVGYDFKWFDLAVRYTWQFLAEASGAQVDALHNMALEADSRLIFQRVLRAIFNNANRTATIRSTAVNVYPFYNNDGTVPPTWKNTTHTGTHQHYITSGAATVDAGDLQAMETHLRHHGYAREGGATSILLVNVQEAAVIRTFKAGTAGAVYDFVPAASQPPSFNNAILVGVAPPPVVNGLPVIGQYGPWLIVEDDWIPAGYMLGFATGGSENARNPVGVREHANTALRGLRLLKGDDNNYPLIESYYNRGFGTGIRHRGAGMVMQVTAAGAYTIPAAYV